MAEEKDEKKIIVDEDWKKQAQDLKEKDVKAEHEQAAEEKAAEEPKAGERQLPPGDFAGLVNILVSQSLFLLGLLVEKGQEARKPDLPLAKYHIDMLGTLEEKTKGNLTDEEDKMLQSVLQQLRMAFVELSSKQAEESEK